MDYLVVGKKCEGVLMSLTATTEELEEILDDILRDLPKFQKGNKTASQRIRTATIRLSKVSKEWRKLSLASERKPSKAKKVVKKKGKITKARKKS